MTEAHLSPAAAARLERWRTPPGPDVLANRIFVIGMALSLIGLITVMSASAFLYSAADNPYGPDADPYRLVKRQAICLLAAVGVYCAVRRIPLPWIDRHARLGLVAICLVLVAVLIPGIGTVEGNASRWLRIGSFSVQPSEFAKVGLIVVLAHRLARGRRAIGDFWQGVLPTVGLIVLVCGLIALEPDLGTSVLLGSISGMMLLVAGVSVRHLLPFIAVGAPLFLAFMIARFEHILPRFRAFLDPMSHYQTKQSLLALGSGGVGGVGLGQGKQKLSYLPQIHGDFLFASIGEEMGLIGTLAVLGLFAALIVYAARMLQQVKDPFAFFLGVGIVGLLGLQAAINIAVVTATAPPKGIALPFISQGGTSLVVMMAALALLVSIGHRAAERLRTADESWSSQRGGHPEAEESRPNADPAGVRAAAIRAGRSVVSGLTRGGVRLSFGRGEER